MRGGGVELIAAKSTKPVLLVRELPSKSVKGSDGAPLVPAFRQGDAGCK